MSLILAYIDKLSLILAYIDKLSLILAYIDKLGPGNPYLVHIKSAWCRVDELTITDLPVFLIRLNTSGNKI